MRKPVMWSVLFETATYLDAKRYYVKIILLFLKVKTNNILRMHNYYLKYVFKKVFNGTNIIKKYIHFNDFMQSLTPSDTSHYNCLVCTKQHNFR